MLGREVVAALRDGDVTAVGRGDLDITDAGAVARVVAGHDIVVNCAAWTDVDGAELHEEAAFGANALGPAFLAEACRRSGAALLHVSSDYVFAGDATEPYPPGAPLAPLSSYGRGKAAGEWAVRAILPERSWIVRTAWLYGERTTGFVPTMLRCAAVGRQVDVIDDVWGHPTWARHVAGRLVGLVDADVPAGVYHAASAGGATWHSFAQAIYSAAGADPELVRPTPASGVPRPARRPARSLLADDQWPQVGLPRLPHWRTAWEQAYPELAAAGMPGTAH
ncbi:NAD(P)-dependent oxidoreductase [Longispora fulva]|nr:NAD(P)-dependent oxidoreductase [Longispora fulva]